MFFQMCLMKNGSGFLSTERIKPLRDVSGTQAFVETGTYLGETTAAMRELFSPVISIELSDELYQAARHRFAADSEVKLLNGDSASRLTDALALTQEKTAVVWLDAHWSGGTTAKADQNTPIVKELELIEKSGRAGDVILVDDIRYFIDLPSGFEVHEANGGYPSLLNVVSIIRRLPGNYVSYIAGDILVAMPQAIWDKVTVSDVVRATMALRLSPEADEQTHEWETIVAGAAGIERETIMALPTFYADSLRYGIGGHFCYWRGLIHESEENIGLARADFSLARRCGVTVPARRWEQ